VANHLYQIYHNPTYLSTFQLKNVEQQIESEISNSTTSIVEWNHWLCQQQHCSRACLAAADSEVEES
jgi:hypothetical protein